MRPMEKGDLIICEMHPKFGGYFTHVERTYCLGEPEKEQLKIYEGCLAAYRCGLEHFGPGKTISTALMAVKDEIDARGLAICEAGIHGHGLASLEYPRFRHHAIAADREAIKVIGDRFEPGMVFAFNIDLLDPKWRQGKTGCVFAETIEITADRRAPHAHLSDRIPGGRALNRLVSGLGRIPGRFTLSYVPARYCSCSMPAFSRTAFHLTISPSI